MKTMMNQWWCRYKRLSIQANEKQANEKVAESESVG